MAVAPMLRITAFAHRRALDEVVDTLQQAGAVEVTADDALPQAGAMTDERVRHELEERMARVEFTREFLGRYHEPEAPFSTFVSEKVHLDEEEFRALEYDESFDVLYAECEQLAGRMADIGREKDRLHALRHELLPWQDLRLQISRWQGTARVVLFTGTIATTRGERVRQELRDTVTELSIEEVSTSGPRQAWVVMVMPEHEAEVRDILAGTDFEEVRFPGLSDYPAEEIARIERSLPEYEKDEEVAQERARELAGEYHVTLALGEALRARWCAQTVRGDFGSTQRTFSISGWIPQVRRAELETAFADVTDVDLDFQEPTSEDRPPVLLDNPRWLHPFETITDLYGRPQYDEADPTGPLSLWFIFFFGICLGDAGYGLALFVIAWLIKHRLDVADKVKQFMDLLMYGGLAAVFVGIFAGSYFAITPSALPEFMQRLIVFDFVGDVQMVLVASVALGVVHIFWGVALKFRALWRQGDRIGAIMDEASTYLMWGTLPAALFAPEAARMPIALAGVGLTVLMKGGAFTPPFGLLRTPLALVKGLYAVYNTFMGHVSDFLSYTRLAALGMASALVGQVMNLIAGLFPTSGRMAVLGILAAVFVLVVGHAINLVMSLLGAFVHPLRLQYVEFFSKFYEGGGARFAPFDYDTRSLILRREPVQEEGG